MNKREMKKMEYLTLHPHGAEEPKNLWKCYKCGSRQGKMFAVGHNVWKCQKCI